MKNEKWDYNTLESLQLELSSYCQASCPGCSRPYDYSKQISNKKKSQSWSLNDFKKHIPTRLLTQINELFICGNYGDPLLCEDLELILDYSLHINPNIFICIHTNGGAGSSEKWKKLANTLKGKRHLVKFSIDGLEDTNSIYRRDVSWNKIMENSKSFISHGGRAVWKFILFKHNSHQIEQARKMSIELGFRKFETRDAYNFDIDCSEKTHYSLIPNNIQKSYKDSTEEELLRVLPDLKSYNEIECLSQKEKYLYIDADLKVWPCCWLAQEGDVRTRLEEREIFYRRIYDRGISKDFNNLRINTLEEIINSRFYNNDLTDSWSKESFNCGLGLNACNKYCSKKS